MRLDVTFHPPGAGGWGQASQRAASRSTPEAATQCTPNRSQADFEASAQISVAAMIPSLKRRECPWGGGECPWGGAPEAERLPKFQRRYHSATAFLRFGVAPSLGLWRRLCGEGQV
eukprot:1082531-Prymnesium_polylepis.1